MYAVVKTVGKQYRVEENQVLEVELLGDIGDSISLTPLMLVDGKTVLAKPSELENALTDQFGSIEDFKNKFADAGATQFGSGWCWLVKDTDGTLKITKTENGVNPICFGQTALLGCDVWEHSYYIDFRNKRPAYLTNFLDNLVNWEYVAAKL